MKPIASFLLLGVLASLATGEAVQDRWTRITTLRREGDRWFVAPIHALLLPHGRLLLLGAARPSRESAEGKVPFAGLFTPAPPGDEDVEEVEIAAEDPPVDWRREPDPEDPSRLIEDELYCAGHALLDDGTVFIAGGTRTWLDAATYEYLRAMGLPYAVTWDGASWARVAQDMQGRGPGGTSRRWYPTCTRLSDATVLVSAGFEEVEPDGWNLSVERYGPEARDWRVLSGHEDTPREVGSSISDYPHVWQLPSPARRGCDVLMMGLAGVPVLADPSAPRIWGPGGLPRRPREAPPEGTNDGASSCMLPLRVKDGEWGYRNGAVLLAGGTEGTSHEESIDVYDPMEESWLGEGLGMGTRRHHPSTVLLPDGQVLVVLGHGDHGDPLARRAIYVDPAAAFARTFGEAELDEDEGRGYHNVAVLLPDGRVFAAGGLSDHSLLGEERPDFRYYYPPYMAWPRPRIVKVPCSIGYGADFEVSWTGGTWEEAPTPTLVLMGLGSQTHSFDMNQRYVQAEVLSVGDGRLLARAPSCRRRAPPGHYMLFLLDDRRVPSVAGIVRLR